MKLFIYMFFFISFILTLISCKDDCKGVGMEYDLKNHELQYTNHYIDSDSLFFISENNKKISFKLQISYPLLYENVGGWASLGGGPPKCSKISGYGRIYYFLKNNESIFSFNVTKNSPLFKINYSPNVNYKSYLFIDGETQLLDTIIQNIEFKKCIKMPYSIFKTTGYSLGFILLEQSYGLRAFKSNINLDTSTYILQTIKQN